MAKIKFSFNLDQKEVEKAVEKVDTMNNIMATDKYHVKLDHETIVSEDKSNIEIKLIPKCTE